MSKHVAAALAIGMMLSGNSSGNFGSPDPPTGPPIPDIENDPGIQKNRGMTRFDFRGGHVYALNRKNAIKKATKKGIMI